jgi:hypothetical protein
VDHVKLPQRGPVLVLEHYDDAGLHLTYSPAGGIPPAEYAVAVLDPAAPCWALKSAQQIAALVQQEGMNLDPARVEYVDQTSREVLEGWSWKDVESLVAFARLGPADGWRAAWKRRKENLFTVIQANRSRPRPGFRSLEETAPPSITVLVQRFASAREANRAFSDVKVPCMALCWHAVDFNKRAHP